MSCSLWRWTPSCDRDVCVGDCDSCDVENWDEYDEAFEEATEMEMKEAVPNATIMIFKMMQKMGDENANSDTDTNDI